MINIFNIKTSFYISNTLSVVSEISSIIEKYIYSYILEDLHKKISKIDNKEDMLEEFHRMIDQYLDYINNLNIDMIYSLFHKNNKRICDLLNSNSTVISQYGIDRFIGNIKQNCIKDIKKMSKSE